MMNPFKKGKHKNYQLILDIEKYQQNQNALEI